MGICYASPPCTCIWLISWFWMHWLGLLPILLYKSCSFSICTVSSLMRGKSLLSPPAHGRKEQSAALSTVLLVPIDSRGGDLLTSDPLSASSVSTFPSSCHRIWAESWIFSCQVVNLWPLLLSYHLILRINSYCRYTEVVIYHRQMYKSVTIIPQFNRWLSALNFPFSFLLKEKLNCLH